MVTVKIVKYLLPAAAEILGVLIVALMGPPLWKNLVIYPRMKRERAEFQKLRKEPAAVVNLNICRGQFHVHSSWSHDSHGSLADLLNAAISTETDFIFLSDHPHGSSDTFPRGILGRFNGILIEPGSEKKGLNLWPLDSAVIDWTVDVETIASGIFQTGGIVFYSHTEESHHWASSFFHGMEIYNFHTDIKSEERTLPHILNFTVNGKRYRHLAYREIFDEQVSILARWDSLTLHRSITGYAAIDAHENINIRARYLNDGRVEWVGPNANVMDTMTICWWNKWLFKPPDQNGWIFKWMIDTYQAGFGFVTNYVYADSLTSHSLAFHLKKGHLYVAFPSLGDAGGFIFYASGERNSVSGIMGDSVRVEQTRELKAAAPYPGRWVLVYNGKPLEVSAADSYEFKYRGPFLRGTYRIEVHLKEEGKYVPWIYSNPVYIY